jgi:hypothetical protein
MSKIEVNQISSQCGSTLTIGQSGDTIQLACGATQTGFGRTGTVDWDTTAKTASFTAVSGNGYFVNTTSGAVTVTLPASPSAGDIVAVKDYANTADTNNITIARNGSNIDGTADDGAIANEGGSITLVYVDATKGWLVTDAAQKSDIVFATYIVATGGTITTCGDYKIHTFTSPGTFCVSQTGSGGAPNTVDYLVVAGGGAGGGAGPTSPFGGGGGAGGFRESSGAASGCYTASPLGACVSALPVSATGYPITVGAGGAGQAAPPGSYAGPGCGTYGSNSVFSTITSTGGGGGGGNTEQGRAGGSGGGGGATQTGGAGNTPPVSPSQGNSGGSGGACNANPVGTGGGGGATAAGGNGSYPSTTGNCGGAGATTSISGTPTAYAGGGGGENQANAPQPSGGVGGGGAGAAGPPVNQPSVAGTTNTGGGGGAGAGSVPSTGANGGSGIVIIRYKYQ